MENVISELECNTKTITEPERDALFDNYRVFLIVMVVISHFTDLSYEHNMIFMPLKWFIVSFHMPAFLFVSGYFSKKKTSVGKLIQKIGIPYLVYEVVFYLIYTFGIHKPTKLYLLRPKFAMWFLMVLFFYKLTAPYIRKIPGHMILLAGAGLGIGLAGVGNFLSIPRFLVYYPFFMAGVHLSSDRVKELRSRATPLKISLAALVSGAITTGFAVAGYSTRIYYGRYSYDYLGQTSAEGILTRALAYVAGGLMIYFFLVILPDRKLKISYIGQRTMPVYIFHALVWVTLGYGSSVLKHIDGVGPSALTLAACIFMVWLFSRKPFVKVTDAVGNIPEMLKMIFQHNFKKIDAK